MPYNIDEGTQAGEWYISSLSLSDLAIFKRRIKYAKDILGFFVFILLHCIHMLPDIGFLGSLFYLNL